MTAMDADRPRPARPISRKRPVTLPAVRPVAVWVITAALVVIGLLFAYAGTVGLADALDHGDEDAQLPSAFAILIGLLTLLCAGGLFVGRSWGRGGALIICAVVFVGAIVGLMAEAITGGIAVLVFAVTLCLFFALLGAKAHDWTGGDAS